MSVATPEYNAIYLSPHLDDAALSCGGGIFQQTQAGQRVLIVTVTAGDPSSADLPPFAHRLHTDWGLQGNPMQGRRAEDVRACQILGADWRHWDGLDCIYRRHPLTGAPLYNNDAELFGELQAAESPLIHTLVARLAALPSADAIYAPLAIGRHVDHQLVRRAAELCWGARLIYYEDYPYAGEPGALEASLTTPKTWESSVLALTPAAIDARIAAIAAYPSQLGVLFGSAACMPRCVRHHIAGVRGERMWRRVV